MLLYNYNDTGLFLRSSEARLDPRGDGRFLIPRNATKIAPPVDVLDGTNLGYWIGNSWSSVPIPEPEEITVEELQRIIMHAIDDLTTKYIERKFKFKDMRVRLNANDQINFEGEKNMYLELLADGVDVNAYFPLEIKVNTQQDGTPRMMAIADLAEYKTFVFAGKQHIRQKLNRGWEIKRTIPALTLEQLKVWVDPRLST